MAEVPQVPSGDDTSFKQILVNPGNFVWQVTFDDNKNQNTWSYHAGSNSPHITGWSRCCVFYSVTPDHYFVLVSLIFISELFHIDSTGSEQIELFGYLPPSEQKWYLTVFEDAAGVPEQTPKFRALSEIKVRDNTCTHDVYTQKSQLF